jgi:hypothetical protein
VLDELHTYRGRQGADVAMLVRRVRERLNLHLCCIGTSATMASEGTIEDRHTAVAAIASRLFGLPVPPANMGFQALAPEKVRLADNDGLMPRDESEGVFPEKVPFRERFL